ncbi:hypothetical protein F7230_02850 [Corynebacterium sp. 320]|uniref:hypothetical protein n=1 Tax=Corynebacterium TaxID=1716 RepID=UPI00125CA9E9|nr:MULTISPECIES: hypothetical protein [Corynebacterium]KAB1504051.1 hypothetical protein F7230_02850 [Corynebacterium sp. 320]KAB1552850.1 hypothetical protein F7233_03745 [Corynebacterium sp. 321]KAB1553932.1 hypothetical protein F7232_02840 [Corynebacterium sp. 319]KAB3528187.1 hypothetical protein F8354_02850 [Corynebacterium sp. 250]KAB3540325.1 hypothetical protein F8390_03490 [Corynebacterium sp. 366]
MRSRSMAIYATVALVSLIVYVIAAFSQGNTPEGSQQWITFSFMGLALAAVASAIIGTLVIARGRKRAQAAESNTESK